MAVVIETTLGDITVDLYLDRRPATCLNFLKLCKMKYYNFNLFHSIRSGFIAQTGDPAGEGSGGDSIWGLLEGSEKRFFSGEKMPKIRHTQAGLLSMVCTADMMVGSQFFLTLGADLDSLDGVHCVIGEVTEGHEVLRKLNEVICDETHRPYQDVRITHTVILEDPFNDPFGLKAPSRSPSPSVERLKGGRIAPDEELDEMHGKSVEEIQEMIEEKEAKARATILEIVGDLPDADIAPPENVLFVCKLNPVTTDEDLEIIFSRFGKIVSCEVIRDKKSGDSLQYAFIEFSDKKSCEDAYFKMDNVLIDDRRIHVDFSQSVSKIKWLGKGRGVKHINDESPDRDIKSTSSNRKHEDSRNNHYRDKYKQHHRDSNRDRGRYNKLENEERNRSHRERSRSKTKYDSSQNKSTRYERHNRNSDINNKDDSNKINISRHTQNKLKSRKEEILSTSKDRQEKTPIRSKSSNEKSRRKMESSPKRDRSQRSPRVNLSPSRDKYSYSEKPAYQREQKVNNIYYSENRDREYKNNKLKMEDSQNSKRKHVTESYIGSKKSRYEDENLNALTPSPIIEKHKQKNGSEVTKQKEKKVKKTKTLKKRRKPSTSSSDSSSSDTSTTTSSDTSSSSGRDRKKSSKRKRKKYSSSSSSSDSSTTSSSDTESDTSSSSDSDRRKRTKNKKNIKKKNVKKTKKR